MLASTIASAWRWRGALIPLVVAGLIGSALWWLLPPPWRAVLPGIDDTPCRCLKLYFSPDSRCLATWHFPPVNQDGPRQLRLWDVASGQAQATLHRGERQLESLAFSPDGHSVAGRWFDRGIQVWARDSGLMRAEYRHPEWQDWNPHMQVTYTPDNQLLAYGPEPRSGKLWDVASGREAVCFLRGDEAFGMVTGSYEAFIVAHGDDRLQAWHLATGELCGTFAIHELSGGTFGLTDDGRTIASYVGGLRTRRLRVWEADTGNNYEVPAGADSSSPVLAPDGGAVAVVLDDVAPTHPILNWLEELFGRPVELTARRRWVRIIDLPGGSVRAELDHADGAKFAPDGQTLAVTDVDGAVYLYDWPLPRPWRRIFGGMAFPALATVACQLVVLAWRRRLTRRAATSK
jgi:WD40 repeat protein